MSAGAFLAFGLAIAPSAALAQNLQPLPPPAAQPEPAPAPAPAPQPYAPPPPYTQPPPQVVYAPAPPPPVVYIEPPPAQHAPKYSLYVGGRLGLLGFGGNFYDNELGRVETTGNYVKSGAFLQADVGARLGKRYIPYVSLEVAGLAPGHRFDGADTKASSSFLGVGFRYVAGDVDTAGFLTDLSFGVRTVTIQSGGSTYKMSSLELFRLGLGAEVRLSTLMTLTPMFVISSGAMSDTEGDVTFGPNGQGDGLTHPTYRNGSTIDTQRGYVVVSIGCGLHFDLFGK